MVAVNAVVHRGRFVTGIIFFLLLFLAGCGVQSDVLPEQEEQSSAAANDVQAQLPPLPKLFQVESMPAMQPGGSNSFWQVTASMGLPPRANWQIAYDPATCSLSAVLFATSLKVVVGNAPLEFAQPEDVIDLMVGYAHKLVLSQKDLGDGSKQLTIEFDFAEAGLIDGFYQVYSSLGKLDCLTGSQLLEDAQQSEVFSYKLVIEG